MQILTNLSTKLSESIAPANVSVLFEMTISDTFPHPKTLSLSRRGAMNIQRAFKQVL